MANIGVIGGAGYIGSHTNKMLNECGHTTIVFDNLENGHIDAVKWGTLFKGDIRNPADCKLFFAKHKIDAVIHFASYINVGESASEPLKYYHNNVYGTLNLLQAMIEANVNKIVFSSTCATYGIPQKETLDEDHPQNPINNYGQTKLVAEKMLKACNEANGLNFVALRYFNASGADASGVIGENHSPETHLIPLILLTALGKRSQISIFGDDYNTEDGTCIRDYIHVNDLATAHVKAVELMLDSKKNVAEFINIGTGFGYSVREVINKVKKITGKEFTVKTEPRRIGDPAVLVASTQKAYETLGFTPSQSELDNIIATAWNWTKKLHS